MAYTTTSSGLVIASALWNADVRDQTIVPFASTAARDSAISSPVVGMLEYIRSNDITEGFTSRNSAGQWRLPWNMPWGVQQVSNSAVATNSGVSGAYLDVGTSVTWTAVLRRWYKFTYSATRVSSPASSVLQVNATDGAGTVVLNGPVTQGSTVAVETPISFSWHEFAIAAGSTTRKIRAANSTAAASVFQVGSFSSVLIVEDMGPSGAPS